MLPLPPKVGKEGATKRGSGRLVGLTWSGYQQGVVLSTIYPIREVMYSGCVGQELSEVEVEGGERGA